jgi:hypothetical protein
MVRMVVIGHFIIPHACTALFDMLAQFCDGRLSAATVPTPHCHVKGMFLLWFAMRQLSTDPSVRLITRCRPVLSVSVHTARLPTSTPLSVAVYALLVLCKLVTCWFSGPPDGLIATTCRPVLSASLQTALPTKPLPPNTTSLGGPLYACTHTERASKLSLSFTNSAASRW